MLYSKLRLENLLYDTLRCFDMTIRIFRKSFPDAYRSSTLGSGATMFRVLLACFGCVCLSPFLAAQDKNLSPAPEPLAVFAGQPIYENQLPASDQVQLQRMMQQVWAVKRRALQTILNQKLVEAEAKKRGLSNEEFLKAEVDPKVAEPSDGEVSAYYQARQTQMPQPFDEMKDKIRQELKNEAIQKARLAYVQGLVQQAVNEGGLVLLLSPPKLTITVDRERLRGDPQAPVTIVEFSDFSCPFCRNAESTIKELLEKYQGRVRLAYRDFPLTQIHSRAELAAEASRCAGEQGKYWEYHDLLFEHPDKQGRDDLMEHARSLKLDDKQFEACLSSGKYKLQIQRDIQLGMASGVSGTPGFFVNGTFLNGAQPAAVFEKIIDQELLSASKPAR
jgi:protein-disulfide isomerase